VTTERAGRRGPDVGPVTRIRHLLNLDLTDKQIAHITNVAETTVARIRATTDATPPKVRS